MAAIRATAEEARSGSDEEFGERHAAYFLAFAEERAAKTCAAGEAQAMAEMVMELENLRSALQYRGIGSGASFWAP